MIFSTQVAEGNNEDATCREVGKNFFSKAKLWYLCFTEGLLHLLKWWNFLDLLKLSYSSPPCFEMLCWFCVNQLTVSAKILSGGVFLQSNNYHYFIFKKNYRLVRGLPGEARLSSCSLVSGLFYKKEKLYTKSATKYSTWQNIPLKKVLLHKTSHSKT